jgi:hypothetical protein
MLGKLSQLVQQQKKKKRHRENCLDYTGAVEFACLMQVVDNFHDQADPKHCVVDEAELAVDHQIQPSHAMEQFNDHLSPFPALVSAYRGDPDKPR